MIKLTLSQNLASQNRSSAKQFNSNIKRRRQIHAHAKIASFFDSLFFIKKLFLKIIILNL